jgi:hypothetical protein
VSSNEVMMHLIVEKRSFENRILKGIDSMGVNSEFIGNKVNESDRQLKKHIEQ